VIAGCAERGSGVSRMMMMRGRDDFVSIYY
jgi:hypothetical protein